MGADASFSAVQRKQAEVQMKQAQIDIQKRSIKAAEDNLKIFKARVGVAKQQLAQNEDALKADTVLLASLLKDYERGISGESSSASAGASAKFRALPAVKPQVKAKSDRHTRAVPAIEDPDRAAAEENNIEGVSISFDSLAKAIEAKAGPEPPPNAGRFMSVGKLRAAKRAKSFRR